MPQENTPAAPGNGEPNKPAPGAGNQPGDDKGGAQSKAVSDMTLDELMAQNPHVSGMFRDLKDERTKRQTLESAEKERTDKALAEQGQFKALADSKANEAKTYREKYETTVRQNAFIVAAQKANIADLDAAWKLADQAKLKVNDDGTVSGADEAVAELAKSKPYLVTKPGNAKVGDPSAPAKEGDGNGAKRQYKRSELRDLKFFEDNKADIMLAMREGRITDDIDGQA